MKKEKITTDKMEAESPALPLMDYLAVLASCTYLSDLKIQSNRQKVRAALESISPEDFPLVQWIEASQYLLFEHHAFSDQQEAYLFLLKHLEN